VQRKVFRVEQNLPAGRAGPVEQGQRVEECVSLRMPTKQRDGNDAAAVERLKRELTLIHDAIARNKRELAALIGDSKERKMARAAGELGAAIDGMEKATVGILKAAEVVDESARALTATLKDDYKRGLAQDIQDNVVQIYEACNFQDLAGQRIGNVIRTLNSIEDQVAAMLERSDDKAVTPARAKPAVNRGLLNGPKLDGDSGHANQCDIDEMFG
jgi:chemotaxis protein CheZ